MPLGTAALALCKDPSQAQPGSDTGPAGKWSLEEFTFCISRFLTGVSYPSSLPQRGRDLVSTLSPIHWTEEKPASQGEARPAPGILQQVTARGQSPRLPARLPQGPPPAALTTRALGDHAVQEQAPVPSALVRLSGCRPPPETRLRGYSFCRWQD